jgi:Tfp pilus assembly protein PilF
MEIKQEQLVFVLVLALLAWWTWSDLSPDGGRRRRQTRLDPPIFVSYGVADPSLAQPRAGRKDFLPRDLFSPPSDTAPLPPLTLQAPPRGTPPQLLPPPTASLGVAAYSRFLRRDVQPLPTPDLFSAPVFEAPTEETAPSVILDEDLMTPQERSERVASWKRLYDWVDLTGGGGVMYGTIANPKRYTLRSRAGETLLFVELDPVTGERIHPVDFPPVPLTPDRIVGWALANTPLNQVSLFRASLGGEMRASDLDAAMIMVDICVRERHGSPRLLEIAEELCRLAQDLYEDDGQQDPIARLKLAGVLEAGFQHEAAFGIYRDLIDKGQHISPVVWTRLADLEVQYRLFDLAEDHYRRAMGLNGAHHLTRWHYGRFLLARGRGAEAVVQLTEAERREPRDSAARAVRVATRTDLGHAYLAAGKVTDATAAFRRAIAADAEDPGAVAGLLACTLMSDDEFLLAEAQAAAEVFAASGAPASFDFMMVQGLAALSLEDPLGARRALELALGIDPFRSAEALRALSFLAETTGHPEEARGFIDQAWQADPMDAWIQFQRARLLAATDDLEGAEVSLRGALDQELDFSEALIAMAHIARQKGRGQDAELYYERALSLDAARPRVHALRGYNLLDLLDVDGAEAAFQRALGLERGLAMAVSGLAWCSYLRGDSREALTRYGELAERLRDPKDPLRIYAEAQAARIVDHESKEVWSDPFERPSGILLGNGWIMDIGFGPEVSLEEGRVRVEGLFNSAGAVRVFREESVDGFLAFEMTVTVEAGTRARIGAFVSRERVSRTAAAQVQASARVGKVFGTNASSLEADFSRPGDADPDVRELFTSPWVVGQAVRLSLQRRGEGSDTVLDVWVGGQEVLSSVPMARLFSSSSVLRFGLFVEGEQGRTCDVHIDNVRVVRRKR